MTRDQKKGYTIIDHVEPEGFPKTRSAFCRLEPDVATKVTLAAIHLHNHLRGKKSRSVYCPKGLVDTENSETGDLILELWRQDASSQLINIPSVPRKSSLEAQNVRHEFAEYFCSAQGELHFHYDK